MNNIYFDVESSINLYLIMSFRKFLKKSFSIVEVSLLLKICKDIFKL